MSIDSCTCCVIMVSNNKLITLLIDTLASIILDSHDRKENFSQKIFGNFSGRGKIISSSYSQLDSTMVILSQTSSSIYLYCYYFNYLAMFKVPPSQLYLWHETLKVRPFQVNLHPNSFCLMLVHEDMIKLHHYTKFQLYQPYATINIQKC